MGRTSLYHHFDRQGRLLYVGISLSHVQRLAQHRKTSHWYWDIACIKVTHYPSRNAAERAERRAIRTQNPLHNVVRPPACPIRDYVVDAMLSAPRPLPPRQGPSAPRKMAYLRLGEDDDVEAFAAWLSSVGVPSELVFIDDASSAETPMLIRLLKTAQHAGTVIYCQRRADFWSARRILRARGVRLEVGDDMADLYNSVRLMANAAHQSAYRKNKSE